MTIKFSDITGGGIPYGNNAGRPANPGIGKLYSNGEAQRLELYTAGGWNNIVQETPGVASITGVYSEATNSGVITISGTNFVSGCYATAIGTNGVQIDATSTTFNSIVNIVATFTGLSNQFEPYDIKVTNPSNLFGIIPDALYVNASPVWQTASGSLGTFNEMVSVSVSATATDSDSTISYALASGSTLPSGLSLNSSTGVISGTLPAISSDTIYNFTINASDGLNIIPRSFSITSSNAINWSTAAGSLGTFYELSTINLPLSAVSPDSATVTYALAGGSSLPSGLTLNSSTGTISGTLPNITTNTTYTFTINALQGPTTTPRTFGITSTAYTDVSTVEVLVVAGGGGGGHGDNDGVQSSGGGAGGLVYDTSKNVSSWIGVSKTLTVGPGGPAGNATTSSDGTNSVFGDITAFKGGYGGGGGATPGGGGSGSYGSGGGQGGSGGSHTPNNAQGTAGQGNQGGYGSGGPGDYAGGGGGAGGAGGNVNGAAGSGGIGRTISITGAAIGYAGGGGNNADLGYGGGFNGSFANRQGKANTGGGGKGSTGAGGSGVVVIAYPVTSAPITTISAGLTYTLDTTTRAGYRVYRFTAGSGTITF